MIVLWFMVFLLEKEQWCLYKCVAQLFIYRERSSDTSAAFYKINLMISRHVSMPESSFLHWPQYHSHTTSQISLKLPLIAQTYKLQCIIQPKINIVIIYTPRSKSHRTRQIRKELVDSSKKNSEYKYLSKNTWFIY